MKSWNFWTQAIKTYFASEADEGLFLIQPGQFDTFNAKLGKDVIDSFTQSNRHSLQRESGVFFWLWDETLKSGSVYFLACNS